MTLDTSRWEAALGVYVLPLAVAAAVVMFVIWRLNRRSMTRLAQELEQARRLVQQRESERDLAQKEIFRRLCEERPGCGILGTKRRRLFGIPPTQKMFWAISNHDPFYFCLLSPSSSHP